MKRFLAILLVFCIAFCFTACGGSTVGSTEPPIVDNATDNTAPDGAQNNDFKATATAINPTVMGTFYRNVVGVDMTSDDPAVLAVDEKADAMLKKIEEYPDSATAAEGGITYYLAENGDDANDGLSPETPKASYAALRSSLKSGDAVLFCRGDIFRGIVYFVSGVTYGAYGEGIKPRLYGSVDGSRYGEGKWEETETSGVYRFNKVINEYSNIVFNNGEAIGRPVQKMENITDSKLNVVYKSGFVYLYCPDGNPQDIYEVIEIAEGYTVMNGYGGNLESTENVHIQNLCIMYAGYIGINVANGENFEIEGCVIGYIGGYQLYLGGISLGNGIQFWGNAHNMYVHDNYLFQCYDAALTHQSNSGMKFSVDEDNIHYTDNLCEYNVYSFEAFVPTKDSSTTYDENSYFANYTSRMGDVYIENNISRYAGWGWGYLDRPRQGVAIMGTTADRTLQIFTNNTILQNDKRKLMTVAGDKISVGDDFDAFCIKYFATFSGNTLTVVE